ncbi:MAG: trehalose-6-phosphate synthase [Bacteroidota bacterium]
MSLILLANRAPVRSTPEGWKAALGGLASALLPVLNARGGAWVASRGPGEDAPEHQPYPEAAPTFTVRRVPLSESEVEGYYNGLSNQVLWPLSHYLLEYVLPERRFREVYRAVNRRFAEAALEIARDSEEEPQFWVQDYHLMLVPALLREGYPGARIGHFWHIPWPAPEVFRILPSARELLRGMLGADLIGFHTEGDAENFRESARDLLGASIEGHDVLWEDRRVRAEPHPIGIDVGKFETLAATPAVVREAERFKREVVAKQIILGVDRLDYTKGLLLRFEAYERFLEAYPEAHGKVSMFQIATPSRTGIPAYDRLKREVEEAVGRINGRFAEGAWAPLRYRYRAYTQQELAALYTAADVAFLTPLRDGMNLVAHEYAVVSAAAMEHGNAPGALVLSELTGAADYLRGAVCVNPYDTDALASALRDALDLPDDEKRQRLADMQAATRDLDVHAWASRFLDCLDEPSTEPTS